METKRCYKCKETKTVTNFHKCLRNRDGLQAICKKCKAVYSRSHYDKEKKLEYQRKWRKNNPEKYRAQWRRSKYKPERYKKYRNSNPDKVKKWKKDEYERMRKDPNKKLQVLLRSRLGKAIKRNSKKGSAVRDLGCTIPQFKLWIEMHFQDGMTWSNWGRGKNCWHLDHIIPLNNFNLTARSQLLKACHYTNIQPLWEKDNLQKRDTLPHQYSGEICG